MTKLLAGLCAGLLLVGFGLAPAPVHAQDEAAGGSATAGDAAEEAPKEETFMDKLKETFKETTTPTDEETDAIGTSEDAGRDLY
ncbi:hypothetical protein [Methyloceanibacter sp. wino2]|uniref:hypothetical protein n=1 Tax=Methyloceanibacter sp. wino2 TaxID=2170729 RepID=UPI000D3E530E|nr:hypothetical protein [Methyloceanibacter sp. wino2]